MIAEEKKSRLCTSALTAFRYFSEQKAVFFTILPCVKAVAAAYKHSPSSKVTSQYFEKKEEIYSNHLLGKRFGRRGRVDLENCTYLCLRARTH